MLAKLGAVDFDPASQEVRLDRYPFPAKRDITLRAQDICEIIDWVPPAIVTTQRDLLFFSREHWDTAQAFAKQANIAISNRRDYWSMILDPFLDTVLSDDYYARTDAALREAGISKTMVDEIRIRLEAPMLRLTAITWEWQHYGLYDALTASQPLNPFKQAAWNEFYTIAMKIALGGEVPPDKQL